MHREFAGLVIEHNAGMLDSLRFVTEWYQRHCDGEWEHAYGVRVDTIDNPDWSIEIELVGTELPGSEGNWVKACGDVDAVWLFWRSPGTSFEEVWWQGGVDVAFSAFNVFGKACLDGTHDVELWGY